MTQEKSVSTIWKLGKVTLGSVNSRILRGLQHHAARLHKTYYLMCSTVSHNGNCKCSETIPVLILIHPSRAGLFQLLQLSIFYTMAYTKRKQPSDWIEVHKFSTNIRKCCLLRTLPILSYGTEFADVLDLTDKRSKSLAINGSLEVLFRGALPPDHLLLLGLKTGSSFILTVRGN